MWESESEEFNQLPGYRGCIRSVVSFDPVYLGCAVVALETIEGNI